MPTDKDWTYQEVLLALDLYVNRPSGRKSVPQAEIRKLARLLGRSPGAVGRKLGNIVAIDPSYHGTGLPHRGSLERPLYLRWANRPMELRDQAEIIRSAFTGSARIEPEPYSRPRGEADTGVSLWNRLLNMTPEELQTLLGRHRTWARKQAAKGAGRHRGDRTVREGQSKFEKAVFAEFLSSAGARSSRKCPSCGHSRLKMNGDPLLEAHHVIDWSDTVSMDSRWGVPLCPNCHALVEVGSLRTRRAIYSAVRGAYPKILENLSQLREEGFLKPDQEHLLRVEGLL